MSDAGKTKRPEEKGAGALSKRPRIDPLGSGVQPPAAPPGAVPTFLPAADVFVPPPSASGSVPASPASSPGPLRPEDLAWLGGLSRLTDGQSAQPSSNSQGQPVSTPPPAPAAADTQSISVPSFSMKFKAKASPKVSPAAIGNVFGEYSEDEGKEKEKKIKKGAVKKKDDSSESNLKRIARSFAPELSRAVKERFPEGFKSEEEYRAATRPLAAACRRYDPGATITLVGSSVTNARYKEKKNAPAFGNFDDSSDYDFGVTSKTLFGMAEEAGARVQGGHTYALNPQNRMDIEVLRKLGLDDALRDLQKACGKHKVSLMIYGGDTSKVTLVRENTPPPERKSKKRDDSIG